MVLTEHVSTCVPESLSTWDGWKIDMEDCMSNMYVWEMSKEPSVNHFCFLSIARLLRAFDKPTNKTSTKGLCVCVPCSITFPTQI